MKSNLVWPIIIPAVIVVVLALLSFSEVYWGIDAGIYDLLLRVRPAVEEDERFVILEIDDASIDSVGMWPWSRHILGDGLMLLREVEADRAVFDIEYLDESPAGVDRRLLQEELPLDVEAAIEQVGGNARQLFQAVAEGQLPPEAAGDLIDDFRALEADARDTLLDRVADVARDNDEYLARAAEIFDSAWFTISMLPGERHLIDVEEEYLQWVSDRFAHREASHDHPITSFGTIQPTIEPIARQAQGLGFTNITVDPDGVRRRINPLAEYNGVLFGQLALTPLFDLIGSPEIEFDGRRMILRNARYPGEDEARDVTIPLTHDGHMMINWPPKTFDESFRHVSYTRILDLQNAEEGIAGNIALMDSAGFLDQHDVPLHMMQQQIDDLYRELLAGERSPGEADQYEAMREQYYDELERFLQGPAEEDLIDQVTAAMAQVDPDDEEQIAELEGILSDIEEIFAATRGLVERRSELFDSLTDDLANAFVIIGQTGIGTVDVGVNPFEGLYFNVGTHAAVANTVFQRDFLTVESTWLSIALAALFAILLGFFIRNLDAGKSLLFGAVATAFVAAAGVLWFVATGRYIPLLAPVGAVFLTFVATSSWSAITNARERSFLRNAFSRYLSADVISQIIDNPDMLALGGQEKYMTAMFTDIAGFSTVSEQLAPGDLVRLLNIYLTEMSNIVLDVKGTIDKYEGDAIIAFFGAPVDDPDHAANACISAVRMKRIEAELNERFLNDNMSPNPLFTRIGINTGEMVVGNMGTEKQMDYTIMGHAVNLAARLEGVNKQYGSWILISEETRNQIGDRFLLRPFDRVRVVGVNEPVQLFEVLEESSSAGTRLREHAEQFTEAVDLFQQRRFDAARSLFADLLNDGMTDVPAQKYIKRCERYLNEPPPGDWDGVYTLSEK